MKEYTLEEIAEHKTRESCWLIMKNKVYNVTPYLDNHPGGADKFLDNAGQDVTQLFKENHHSKIPQFIAQNYEIGTVKVGKQLEEKEVKKKHNSPRLSITSDSKIDAESPRSAGSGRSARRRERGAKKGAAPAAAEVAKVEYTLTADGCEITKKQFVQLAEVAGGTLEAGVLIYDALFKSMNPVKHLFKTPKKVLAFRVISQIERLVNHVTNEEFLETELYNMAMRHLAYVTYDEMKKWMDTFTNTILDVIKTALDEYWTDTAHAAWSAFYNFLGSHLLKNSAEFGGKVTLLRSSWQAVEDLRGSGESKGNSSNANSGAFGDALYFNLGVMSPEISALIQRDRSELSDLFERGFKMMVTFVSDPPTLNEELYILAARHLDYGTEEHHFPVFGQAIMVTLRSLLPRAWNWAHEDAWGWLWDMASKFMIKTVANGHAHKQRLDDSMTRLESADMDDFGAQFYLVLFKACAEIQQYFYKPNSLIKFIVSKVIKMIVTLLHSTDEVIHGVRALGMRHIKYAIPPDLFPYFGVALTTTLPSFLEGFWDENIREAWSTVFEFVKDCMTRAVVSGTNLVTKALVSNDVGECAEALSGAPRNERLLWLLEVDVSNIKVSPFNWALQDAKFAVAEFMLDDILMIRADREAYYYGKDMLFRVHPDLIEMLCRLAPQMLFNVFDGLMWHSRNITNGKRRVNYYIREAYGNPHEEMYKDSFKTPLAQLTSVRDSSVFTHPYVLFLIDLKWLQLGRNKFIRIQLINLMVIVFLMLGWVVLDLASEEAFVCRCVTFALVIASLSVFQLSRIWHEIQGKHLTRICWGVYIPVFLTTATNTGRLVANLALMVACFTDRKFFPDDLAVATVSSAAVGIACCLLFTLLIETSKLSVTLLKYQYRLGAVGFQFIVYLLCMVFLLLGFATSMILSRGRNGEKSENFDTLWHSLLNLYATTLGLYKFELSDFSAQMLILYIMYSITTIFVLTRLLLAIMSTITIEQDRHVEGFALIERADLTIELESSRDMKYRQKVYDSMRLDEPLEFDAGDLGPAGGVQVLEVVGRQKTNQSADDRITRFPGQCDPGNPWPRIVSSTGKSIEERLDKLTTMGEKMRKTIVDLQKRGFGGGGGTGLPTLSEGESNISFQSDGNH